MATGDMNPEAKAILARLEASMADLTQAIMGNLRGEGGILRRQDKAEAQLADHETRIVDIEAAGEKTGDRTWDVALGLIKSAASAAIGAAAALLATKGAPH